MKNGLIKRRLIFVLDFLYENRRMLHLRLFYHLRIMSPDQTIEYIKRHHCSISRFGDGEFDVIFQTRDLNFQKKSSQLSRMLSDVLFLSNNRDNLLICIPRCMNTVRGCNDHASRFWIEWGKKGHHEQIVDMLRLYTCRGYVFGDSQITRPYIDWKTDRRAKRTFPKLRHLWDGRNVIVVEGDQTRMGVGNDLFDNTKSVQRILCPAEDAFESREKIKKEILNVYHGELILMALGPTATVLAAEFAQMGIQALDIGNIDIEYEWYLRGAKERIEIPGKYTNEAKIGNRGAFSTCNDEKYLNQIIARVNC